MFRIKRKLETKSKAELEAELLDKYKDMLDYELFARYLGAEYKEEKESQKELEKVMILRSGKETFREVYPYYRKLYEEARANDPLWGVIS